MYIFGRTDYTQLCTQRNVTPTFQGKRVLVEHIQSKIKSLYAVDVRRSCDTLNLVDAECE